MGQCQFPTPKIIEQSDPLCFKAAGLILATAATILVGIVLIIFTFVQRSISNASSADFVE